MDLRQISFSAKRENVPPTRQPNQASLRRKYLTPDAVKRMIIAARQAGGRLAEHDVLLIMMAWRHGFRASELIPLCWDQIDLKADTIHASRLKHGSPSSHPRRGPELKALRVWKREQLDTAPLYLGHKNIQHIVRYMELSSGRFRDFWKN